MSSQAGVLVVVLSFLLAVACGQTLHPRRKDTVYKCTWSAAQGTCGVNTYYFLSKSTPVPGNPYTKRILSSVARDYKCAVYKNAKTCNAAYKDYCIWDGANGCSFALTNDWACPGSRGANFLKCDYFNLVKAPSSTCKAAGCTWTKGRGCFDKSFSAWGPRQLVQLRNKITNEDVDLTFYGCCSSFLSRRDLYPDTCYDLDNKKDCQRATKVANCVWADGSCGLNNDGIYQAEIDGLKTADPPFGIAYAAADDACFAIADRAGCLKPTAKLDTARLARYQQPHREAKLDFNTYCGTTILGA